MTRDEAMHLLLAPAETIPLVALRAWIEDHETGRTRAVYERHVRLVGVYEHRPPSRPPQAIVQYEGEAKLFYWPLVDTFCEV